MTNEKLKYHVLTPKTDLEESVYFGAIDAALNETSVIYQPIAEKTKLMWNCEDLKYAIKGVVGVIADDYDEKRDNQAGRMYWTGDKAIEFGGDYYTLQIAPNGRIDTWYRMKNNILGK